LSQNTDNWQKIQALVMDIRDRLQSASYSMNRAVQNMRRLTQLIQRMAPQRPQTAGQPASGGISQEVQDAQTPSSQPDMTDEE